MLSDAHVLLQGATTGADGDTDGETETDGDTAGLGDDDAVYDALADADGENDGVRLGVRVVVGVDVTDAVSEADTDADGLPLVVADCDGEIVTVSETEAEGEEDAVGSVTRHGGKRAVLAGLAIVQSHTTVMFSDIGYAVTGLVDASTYAATARTDSNDSRPAELGTMTFNIANRMGSSVCPPAVPGAGEPSSGVKVRENVDPASSVVNALLVMTKLVSRCTVEGGGMVTVRRITGRTAMHPSLDSMR
jgi:hypothetical protein